MTTGPDSISQGFEARVGTVLRGKYRLEQVLHVGAMAVVYKATHKNQAEFAVKMLHAELNARQDIRTRFLREGYAANSVKHPGAVRIVDDDVSEDGVAFVVMELLEGASVATLRERAGGRLSPRAVLTLAEQLLDVLVAAHDKGIVHGDLKAENLFVTRDGSLKVLDFGITRLRASTSLERRHAEALGLGAAALVDPEQELATASEVDGQTDLRAVGATLYTLLTGQSGSSVPSNVPSSLAAAIDRALASDKSARWASAVEMRDGILAVKTEMFGARPSRIALVDLLAQEPAASSVPEPPSHAVFRSGPEETATGAAVTVGSASKSGARPRQGSRGLALGLGACLVLVAGFGVSASMRGSPRARDATSAAPGPSSSVTEAAPSSSASTVASSAPPPPAPPTPHRCATGDLDGCIAECAQKDLGSCSRLATVYRTGRGGAKDEPKAFALYKAGCDAGDLASCDGLGLMVQNGLGGVERDDGRALRLFRKGCDGGLGVACVDLGQAYLRGKGTPKDDARAVALYKQACDLPTGALGCSLLGALSARGRTVQQDTTRGLALLRKGCEAGDPLGCASLGELYAEGKILPKDEARAVALFKQGCPAEGEPGCFALGLAYEKGLDVPVDRAKAADLYRRGCKQDDPWACAQAKRLKGR